MKLLKERILKNVCKSEITCMDICKGTKTIACGAFEEPIKILNYPFGKLLRKIPNNRRIEVFEGEDPRLIIASQTGSSYNNRSFSIIMNSQEKDYYKGPSLTPNHVKFLDKGNLILSSYRNGEVNIYNTRSGKNIKNLKISGKITSMEFLKKTNSLLFCTDKWKFYSFNMDKMEIANSIELETGNLGKFQLSSDLKKLFLVFDTGWVKCIDLKSQREIFRYKPHKSGINCIQLSPNGKIIATAGNDSKISLFNSMTGEKIHYLTEHFDEVHSIIFSYSGRYLISSSEDYTLKIWDVKRGKLIKELEDVPNAFKMILHDKRIFLGNVEGQVQIYRLLENVH